MKFIKHKSGYINLSAVETIYPLAYGEYSSEYKVTLVFGSRTFKDCYFSTKEECDDFLKKIEGILGIKEEQNDK